MNCAKATRSRCWPVLGAAALFLPPLLTAGCASTSIAIKEKFGYVKREQLVDNVKSARDEQDAAKKQFASALERFLAVTGASAGELEVKYAALKTEHERSKTRAEAVTTRINAVDDVARELFSEWQGELAQYQSATMRQASERQLQETRARYDQLLAAMRSAEAKMKPVLAAFADQVLYLKHNLNARAVASLQSVSAQVQSNVTTLVRDMEKSIAEANAFIERMQSE